MIRVNAPGLTALCVVSICSESKDQCFISYRIYFLSPAGYEPVPAHSLLAELSPSCQKCHFTQYWPSMYQVASDFSALLCIHLNFLHSAGLIFQKKLRGFLFVENVNL